MFVPTSLSLLLLAAAQAAAPDPAAQTPSLAAGNYAFEGPLLRPANAVLVWQDEFSGKALDRSKWAYDTAFNKQGWHNKELQYYSAGRRKNSRVENGVLIIELRREKLDPTTYSDWGGQQYTSARLLSKGTGAWTYGFFEIRAKLPCARGTWPAIWMLPVDFKKWPDDGEIDIMEHVGSQPEVIHANVHTGLFNHVKKTHRGASRPLPTSLQRFPPLPARLAARRDHDRLRRPGDHARAQRPARRQGRLAVQGAVPPDSEPRDGWRLGGRQGHRRQGAAAADGSRLRARLAGSAMTRRRRP